MRLMWYDAFVNVYACARASVDYDPQTRVVCPQVFNSATAFNQDLSAWNVARVSSFYIMFDSATAFSGCNQRRVYDAWGATFKAAYPSFYTGSCLFATDFSPLNAPASRSAAVTILGLGFGALDASPSAYVSGQPCATTSWTSATQLVCSASAPTVAGGALPSARPSSCPDDGHANATGGAWREAWLKVDTNTASSAFTFDGALLRHAARLPSYAVWSVAGAAPVVSATTANAAPTAGGTVTISGLSFGAAGASVTASLTAADTCGSSAWTSATTVVCAPQAYGGTGGVRTAVSVSGVAGTLTVKFSFDGACATFIGSSRARSGSARRCIGSQISWHPHPCFDTVAAPCVSMSSPSNVGATGGGTITIGGLGFGGLVVTPSASLGVADMCGSTAWTSATTVACGPAAYGGSAVRTSVSVSAGAGTLTRRFSFDGSPLGAHRSLLVARRRPLPTQRRL